VRVAVAELAAVEVNVYRSLFGVWRSPLSAPRLAFGRQDSVGEASRFASFASEKNAGAERRTVGCCVPICLDVAEAKRDASPTTFRIPER
jgi:hypothetical protein